MINILEVAALNGFMQLHPILPVTETASILVQQDLYFGRNTGTTRRVTKQQFQQFIEDVVTPRFPTGVTEYDTQGRFLDSDGNLIHELSKVISLVHENNASSQPSINAIAA
jgi:hypothetical protein